MVYSRVLADTEVAELQTYFESAYGINVARPVATPVPGLFQDGVTVTLTDATPAAVIHYTTDGSDPDESAPVYSARFTLSSGGLNLVKARAYLDGGESKRVGNLGIHYRQRATRGVSPSLAGAGISTGNTITSGGLLEVSATDAAGISRVEFLLNGELLGSDGDGSDGFSFPLVLNGIVEDGSHTITFRAVDTFGTATSLDIDITLTLAPPAAPC